MEIQLFYSKDFDIIAPIPDSGAMFLSMHTSLNFRNAIMNLIKQYIELIYGKTVALPNFDNNISIDSNSDIHIKWMSSKRHCNDIVMWINTAKGSFLRNYKYTDFLSIKDDSEFRSFAYSTQFNI